MADTTVAQSLQFLQRRLWAEQRFKRLRQYSTVKILKHAGRYVKRQQKLDKKGLVSVRARSNEFLLPVQFTNVQNLFFLMRQLQLWIRQMKGPSWKNWMRFSEAAL